MTHTEGFVGVAERRRRMARRHAIAPWSRVETSEAATAAVGVLHATEPATVFLSIGARLSETNGATARADTDRALYRDRSLVKQLAMRRTLFVFPRELLPAAWGSASARLHGPEFRRLAKDIEQGGVAAVGDDWVATAEEAATAFLGQHGPATAADIRRSVPEIDAAVELNPGKSYGGTVQMGPRVLTLLGMRASIMRGDNTSHWRVMKPEWQLTETWLGVPADPLAAAEGYRELVRTWLERFGPGTENDLVWWLGATKSAVRTALADLEAVTVHLDDDQVGYVLPDDVDPTEPDSEPWAALLPVLDPTIMGWKDRDWYLGPHASRLFDRNGNAGTTVLIDGRVVGCWTQDGDGTVRTHLLEKVSASERSLVDDEAKRLTDWLDGESVGTVYPSPLMKENR